MNAGRTLAAVLLLAVAAGCGAAPAELARTTPYELARSEGRYVTVNGLQTFAITAGAGRPVLLIHGNPSNTYSWRKVIRPLATRYRVDAIDLPGYGFSDKPRDAPYTTEWLARHVVAYLDAVGVGRALLVGSSMGGYVASETALLFPDRVSALVLVDASGLPEATGGYPLAVRMSGWPVLGPVLRALPARGRVRASLENAVYDPTQVTDADVDAYYAPLRSAGRMNAFVARMKQPTAPERADRVRTIRAPTLVITGDTDRLVAPATARRYHELIAASELLVMPRTGHLPHEEHPDEFVRAVTTFLDAHP